VLPLKTKQINIDFIKSEMNNIYVQSVLG